MLSLLFSFNKLRSSLKRIYTKLISEKLMNRLHQEMESKLLEDIAGLLVSGSGSDVTIQCQGEEFRAHRLILSVR